jgi:hypothetical protein
MREGCIVGREAKRFDRDNFSESVMRRSKFAACGQRIAHLWLHPRDAALRRIWA